MKILMVARRDGSDESTLASLPLAVGKSARKQDNEVYLRRSNEALTLRRKVLGGTLLLTACLGGPWMQSTWADSKDGIFPSADQVGGEVYRDPLPIGTHFPTDFEVFDMTGHPADLSHLVLGKRTAIAFFVVAAPASVLELKKLQDFVVEHAPHLQVLNLHVNTVQADLTGGGPTTAVQDTIRTVALARKEHDLRNPTFVAPNDTMSPSGLSNRLGVRGVPTIFVLGADGKVQNIFIGPHDWKPGDL